MTILILGIKDQEVEAYGKMWEVEDRPTHLLQSTPFASQNWKDAWRRKFLHTPLNTVRTVLQEKAPEGICQLPSPLDDWLGGFHFQAWRALSLGGVNPWMSHSHFGNHATQLNISTLPLF